MIEDFQLHQQHLVEVLNKLQGENIPIFGWITAIADVFDALTSTRPYKNAWEIDDAFELLIDEKGKHFDPILVDMFIQNKEEVITIFNRFKEEDLWNF